MLRTALLGGNSITLDADMSKYIETLSEQGVIEGLEVSSGSVAPGKAWVKATRSNGETIMVLVQNIEALAVDTSGTKKIWLEIRQEAIDNGLLNNEDGTGIASIKTGPTLPSQNSLLLASVADGVVKDERNLIPKIQSVAQRTDNLEEKMTNAEGQISQLVEAGTPSYLGITAIVGEKYTMEDTLFLQKTPTLEDSTIAINVGDTNANKEQHIQRIASGTASNQLKLKMKKFGAPTTSVVVEVRKGIKVDVSDKEAYRYGGEVVATTTIAYTQFTTEWKEFTLTLNNQFGATKGELLDIVVYQQGGIVNGTNYYQIACDSTQYSEAFSVVAVNGSSRVRSRLMPYCVSEGVIKQTYAKMLQNRFTYNGTFTIENIPNEYGEGTLVEIVDFNQVLSSLKAPIGLKNRINIEMTFTRCDVYNNSYPAMVDGEDVNAPYGSKRTDGGGRYKTYRTGFGGASLTYRCNNIRYATGTIQVHANYDITTPKKQKIREIKNIGESAESTIFGIHTDQQWIGEINTTLSQTARTGEIYLGKCVGYMSIKGSDGKIYKIPVYGE